MIKINPNKILSQVANNLARGADRVVGISSKKLSNTAEALKGASKLGIKGVPKPVINRAERMAKVEKGRVFQTRVKAGVGATAGTALGFLGLHKYHQHVDQKLMEKIDKYYN